MGKKKIDNKFKSAKWKQVKIDGNLVGDDLEGFAGLEVLENYNSSFLSGTSKNKSYLSNELDGDIFDVTKKKGKKNKKDEDESENSSESENEEKNKEDDQPKKKKLKKANQDNFPGKFVLLNPPSEQDRIEELFSNEENSEIRTTWNQIGITSDEIIRSLIENNFKCPTEIQRLTIPVSAYGKFDILAASETGSGKSLAFLLPIVQNVQKSLKENEKEEDNLFSLILTPTRELAQQIHKHLDAVAKYTKVTTACLIGGLAIVKQERVLNSNPNIIIGTPGRVWELIQDGNKHMQKIINVKYLVIDETDRMLQKGHFAELEKIIELLNSSESNPKRQTFVFSATLTMTHELPEYVLKKKKKHLKQLSAEASKEQRIETLVNILGMKNSHKVFDITKNAGVAEKVVESRILCSLDEKDFYLYYILLQFPGRTLVFCNSIDCVKRTVSVLSCLNVSPISLHGHMEQKQRLKNLEKFQKHEDSIMIATNCAARGLDIPNVQHVIHYQVPTTGEDYVHRSGRTARANKEGLSVLIIEPNEVKNYVKLQKTLGRNEDLPMFPVDGKIMRNVKERVRKAREIESLEFQLKKTTDMKNWKKKAADDIGILDSDDDDNESNTNRHLKQINLALKHKKADLAKMLSTSLIPGSIYSLKFPIGQINEKIETNPLNIIKKAKHGNFKAKKMKLFRKRQQ
ncbi:hypothetical protein PVAND_008635 [Polypedilum vanderplanki]|uniref:ATP-dependent RNA helicase n=1 Tax=Polypedilum vanderplanki TaxID=319348 RepID=A0A9J6CAE7_POLVA|nr:hypothetical protein PVAND_008635 [Polypedilum vanderplanki]